ncbi:MAG: heterodisulfide reductase-related iron-sulfur binding cluster [Thermoplasmata archaeon]|jgi:Fe-S oxidoreductase
MDIGEFIDIIAKESLKDLMPLGIKRERIIEDSPDHEYYLFTGQLYQITPYLESLREIMERLENIEERFFSIYPYVKNIVWKVVRPKEKERYRRIVVNAYNKLRERIDLGYDFSIDYYTGIIFYEMGSKYFDDYARKMISIIGNRKLITLDPHTTYALRVIYREIDPDFNPEVHHYTEFIELGDLSAYVDHESCYLNRYLDINIKNNASKPEHSGKETGCCGGPIELISPRLATAIANSRMDELLKTGKNNVLVWCPICLSNLSRLKRANVRDILEII